MARLSIEISEQEHQAIKGMAAFRGQTIKEFTKEKIFSHTTAEELALQELLKFLKPRLDAVEQHNFVDISMKDLMAQVIPKE
jgi:hypothetical protein